MRAFLSGPRAGGLRVALGLGLTALCVFLLIGLINWNQTFDALQGADTGMIAAALGCLLVSLIAKTVRWQILLPAQSPVPLLHLYRILHISFLLNNVLPARIGDVARVSLTSRQPGVRVGHVVSSLLSERATDILTLVASFVVVSPFLPLSGEYIRWLHITWFALGCTATAILLVVVLRRHIAALNRLALRRLRIPIHQRLKAELSHFADSLRELASGMRLVQIGGWSLAAWAGAFAINYFLMRGLDIDAPFTVAVLITCTTNLATLIPSSPGGIGVFHAAATLSLIPFGVGDSTALSFAILAHLVNVVPVSIIGLICLLIRADGVRGQESLTAPAGNEAPLATEPASEEAPVR